MRPNVEALVEFNIKDEFNEMANTSHDFARAMNRFRAACDREGKRRQSWLTNDSSPEEQKLIESEIKQIQEYFPSQLYAQLLRWKKSSGI